MMTKPRQKITKADLLQVQDAMLSTTAENPSSMGGSWDMWLRLRLDGYAFAQFDDHHLLNAIEHEDGLIGEFDGVKIYLL